MQNLLIDFFKFFINEADMECPEEAANYYVDKYLKKIQKEPATDDNKDDQGRTFDEWAEDNFCR